MLLPYRVIVIFFLLAPTLGNAQCISGDCENGTGSKLFNNNLYTGNFVNGLPEGQGSYGTLRENNNLTIDSIQYTGFFRAGVLLDGEKTIVATGNRSIQKNDLSNKYARQFGKIWYLLEIKNKPEKLDYPKDYGKDVYGFNQVNGYNFFWRGNLKKGRMDGKGILNDDGTEMEATFNKGILTGPVIFKTKRYQSDALNAYSATNITSDNGLITGFLLVNSNTFDSLIAIISNPISIFTFLKLPTGDGTFDVRYKNGDRFTGDMKSASFNGYGEFTDANGTKITGYFLNGLVHGNALKNNHAGSLDSGLFLFGKFTKGICTRPGKGQFNFPICESGDCNNGFGKARYRTIVTDTLKDYYEGNFVNGIPNGSGTSYFQNKTFQLEKKGIFSAGLLMGDGTITANAGLVRKMKGYFISDTLVSGRIEYSDGSSFDFTSAPNSNQYEKRNRKLRYAWLKEKFVPDMGTYYLPSGSKVTGKFNDLGYLVDGYYENPKGISMNMGHAYDANFTSLRILERPYIDNLDIIATKYVAVKQQLAEETNRLMLAYAAAKKEQERKDAINSANMRNPANFKKESGYEKCGSCDGVGHFDYTNTFGRVVAKVDVDNKSEIGTVVKQGRTYTNRVKCGVCGGAGRIYVSKDVYTGPPIQ